MTDARYPEAWLNDRRILRLSDAAHRLFVTALAWAASNRTDGFIDGGDLALLQSVDESRVGELVASGLWSEAPGGWRIVAFDRTQTTRAQLEGLDHKRHKNRERQARQRAHKKDFSEAAAENVSRVTSGVTTDVTQRQGKDRQGQAITERPLLDTDENCHDEVFLPHVG